MRTLNSDTLKEVFLLRTATSRMMKEVPVQARPRERLWEYGEESLSDQELLAILLRTGTRSANVMELAMRTLMQFGDLYQLKQATLSELMAIPGIGKIKAIEIRAAIELGARITKTSQLKFGQITSSKKAGEMLMEEMQDLQQEHVVAMFLNTKNEIIKKETLFIGSLNSSVAHPREIFKGAVRYSAARIILGHNHPSGNPEPSQADCLFTKRVKECGELMGIELLDHFVIGEGSYISLKEYGWI